MISLHTNISSIIAQQSLNTSTNRLNRAIEQMSTGFKINHAGDNAANYSISTNMSTQLNAYEVARDNTAMGLDMVSTANGTLDEVQDRLARLRALAEQANNGTYGTSSKNAINAEVNAIIDEISRVCTNTEYNGINLMYGNPIATLEGDFIKEVHRKDTSKMTALGSVDPTQMIESGTYSISTADELAQLATMTNNGLIGAATEFVMANDIDLSAYSAGEGWTPIGLESSGYQFKSLFDGNGYKITNLKINRSSSNQGLFGRLYNTSSIMNLRVEDADINANIGGIIAGGGSSNILNCSTSGSIQTTNRTGGIVGSMGGTIDSCYSTATIKGKFTGGIVSYAEGITCTNCYYDGSITCTASYAGGIADCATGNGTNYFRNCYSSGTITNTGTGTNAFAGGILGSSKNAVIENCYSSSKIQANKPRGGLIGKVNAGVTLNISNSAVLNSTSNLNGLYIGQADDTSNIIITDSSYNSGLSISNYVGSRDNSFCTTSNITTNDGTPTYTISNDKGIVVSGGFSLQVGINSDDDSKIEVNTDFNIIDNVERLRRIGTSANVTKNALPIIDALIKKIANKQTELGAAQNRLESALESTATNIENLTSSRSTLRDADIGEVSSQFIRQQILQQAAATLMSTANQAPAIALQLI